MHKFIFKYFSKKSLQFIKKSVILFPLQKQQCVGGGRILNKPNMILVDESVLPEVFLRVLKVKQMILSGEEKSVVVACSKIGISRSAYYKYKDHIFTYDENSDKIITILAVLADKAGILSNFMTQLYHSGANILTVNQDIPISGKATLSVSLRIGHLKISVNELIASLKSIDGVKSINRILGDY